MNDIPVPILYLKAKLAAAEELRKKADENKNERLAARLARDAWKLKREIYLRTKR